MHVEPGCTLHGIERPQAGRGLGGGVEFKPHLCLLLFLPLSFHLDDWDNTTRVNTVTDMTLSQDAGTSGSGFQ